MIIDVHLHPFCKEATVTPSYEAAMERMYGDVKNPKREENIKYRYEILLKKRSISDIIKDMDEARVDVACIVAMDMTTKYGVTVVTNDDVAKFAETYPNRFIPFASVDPSLGWLAVEGLEHAVRDLGCRGVKLCPPVQKFDFSDPRFEPLWEKALQMDIVVWTHTAHQMGHPGSDARLGHPMLIEPVAIKYPDLKIIQGHCGFPWVWEAWSLAVRHPNVYVDISAYINFYNNFPWNAYSKLAKYGAEDKVLFATDYPIISFHETLEALDRVDISLEFKNKILGENARKLLNL
jgi:predicted TIM-barrel fold metal-dependent hydrolase